MSVLSHFAAGWTIAQLDCDIANTNAHICSNAQAVGQTSKPPLRIKPTMFRSPETRDHDCTEPFKQLANFAIHHQTTSKYLFTTNFFFQNHLIFGGEGA